MRDALLSIPNGAGRGAGQPIGYPLAMPGVAVLTPFAAPSVGGNAVTVGRIARGLRERGLDVRVWDLSVTPVTTVEADVAAYRPEILHAFHAGRAGPVGLRLASRLALPLVVTLTGTDANHDLPDIARGAAVRAVLEAAATITAFHESIVGRVLRSPRRCADSSWWCPSR